MPSIRLEDMPGYVERLGKAMREAAMRGLVLAGQRGVQTIVTQIIPSRSPQPVDRGVYRAGWKSIQETDSIVSISNAEPHAVFIEYGVRAENVKPGAAMVKALTEWVIRKGFARDQAKATGIAWAIINKMKKRGIFNNRGGAGLRVLEELNQRHINNIIQEEVSREIAAAANATR